MKTGFTVFKYKLDLMGATRVNLGLGARELYVGFQEMDVCIWIEQAYNTPKDAPKRVYKIVPTGSEIPSDSIYIGTAQEPTLAYVWHVYQVNDKGGKG